MPTNLATRRSSLIVAACLLSFPVLLNGLWPAQGGDADALTDPAAFLPFVADHRAAFAAPFVVGLIMHLAGVVVVLGLHGRLRHTWPWAAPAAALGLFWMAFDIAYNGVVLHVAPEAAAIGAPAHASFDLLMRTTSALQLTGHLAGGTWLALTAIGAGRAGLISIGLQRWGLVAGVAFAVSFLGPTALYPSFLLLPVFFIWLGRSMSDTPMGPSVIALDA